MDNVDKLWKEVDSLKESRIRHDERMKQLSDGQIKTMEHFAKLEAKFDDVRGDITEGFKTVASRIDELEEIKAEGDGYKKGQQETRVAMLKMFGIWLTVIGLGVSIIAIVL